MNMRLPDYLGVEETNLIVSLVNFRLEVDLFSEVDGKKGPLLHSTRTYPKVL